MLQLFAIRYYLKNTDRKAIPISPTGYAASESLLNNITEYTLCVEPAEIRKLIILESYKSSINTVTYKVFNNNQFENRAVCRMASKIHRKTHDEILLEKVEI